MTTINPTEHHRPIRKPYTQRENIWTLIACTLAVTCHSLSFNSSVPRFRYNCDGLSDGEYILGDSRVDRHHLILSSYNEIHPLSSLAFGFTHSFWDFVDPCTCVVAYGQVVSHALTCFLCSSSNYDLLPQFPLECHERFCGVLMIFSLLSSSIVSPQCLCSLFFSHALPTSLSVIQHSLAVQVEAKLC